MSASKAQPYRPATRAEQHAEQLLRPGRQPRQQLLEAAGHDQPGQRGRQGGAAQDRDAQQPALDSWPRRTSRPPPSRSPRTARPAGSPPPGRRRTASARARRRRLGPAASGNADNICESFIRNVAFRPIIGDPCRNQPGANQYASPPSPAMNQLDKKSQAWSALFSRADERAGQALHRQRVFRQAPVAGRHRGLAGACRHAGRARASSPPPTWPPSKRAWPRSRRKSNPAPVRVEARPGGRAPQHRGPPDPAGRRRRQAPAHRPQPQRPGRHRRAPVAARRDRPDRRPAGRPAEGAAGHRREERRGHPARLHAPAGGAAGELRPPHAGLRGDVQPRRRTHGRRAQAREPPAAGRRRPGRHQLSAGPRAGGAHARAWTASARTRWTR